MKTETTQARVSGTLDPIVGKCRRTIVWHGEVQEIEVENHSFAWSGRIPCTGMRRCIYCGQYEHDLANATGERRVSRTLDPIVGQSELEETR